MQDNYKQSSEDKVFKDSYRHKGMRRRMVSELMELGISDSHVLEAMLAVPRHFFFESAFIEKSYENRAFPIGEGQTISQPFTVAYQTQMLDVQPNDRVLEIGTGSGYQACVLAVMGAKVVTIERQKLLYDQVCRLLGAMPASYIENIIPVFGDGYEGAEAYAPFNKILVTAAAPKVPMQLLEQLVVGGIMVVPVGTTTQTMLKIVKTADKTYCTEQGETFVFVPMLNGTT